MTNDKIISIILEKVDYTIDEEIKKLLQSTKVRKEMLKKYGAKAFLDPKELKFPVINPKTGNFDCKLIYAALLRSSVYASKGSSKHPKDYYVGIKAKAIELYKSQGCSKILKINLNQEEIDVLSIGSIFNITESEYDNIIDKTNYIG